MQRLGILLGCAVLLLGAGSSEAAEPGPRAFLSPLAVVQTFHGDVEMRSSGQTVVVTLRDTDGVQVFEAETDLLTGLPQLGRTEAEVRFWRGHLVVIAPREGKAWHFSVPGADAFRRPEDPPLPGREVDAELRASYELTRIGKVIGLISRSGPAALDPKTGGLQGVFAKIDTEYQDPTSGGGVGSCGKTCNMTCGDGSTCSVTCAGTRCAACSCPATCTCR